MSGALISASNICLGQTQAAEYAAAQVAQATSLVADYASRTTYNNTAYSRTTSIITNTGAARYVTHFNDPAVYWASSVLSYPGAAFEPAVIQSVINEYLASPTDTLLMADCEIWDLSVDAQRAEAIPNLQLYASMWQDQTDRELGFYYYPFIQHVRPIEACTSTTKATVARQQGWLSWAMHLGDSIFNDLLPYVNHLIPSVYQQDADDVANWRYAAAWSILEAIRLAKGKPVYPIVYHKYTDGLEDLSEANYVAALQFVAAFPGIAGVILWEEAPLPAWYEAVITELVAGTSRFEDT
jgi:hypothetical protein